jgi:ABC-2 type transport system ATP-binding protein
VHAISTRAELLVLDEPTSGLDPLMEVAFRETVKEAQARGQAVFLSSHILSEVEVLCDRIGILRAGRMVDEGTLDELRHLRTETIEVTFAQGVPELAPIEGITVAHTGPNTLRFEVNGSIAQLLAQLARADVVGLIAREPSLEEIFLHHYGAVDGDAG